MFGRLDEDEELSREYIITRNDPEEPEFMFLYGKPWEIKDLITEEVIKRPGTVWDIWENVEQVDVTVDGGVSFIEDYGSIEDFIVCESLEELREKELADDSQDS